MPLPKYLQDIQKYIDRVPYGDIQFTVKRRNNKVIEVVTNSVETTKHEDNSSSKAEIVALMDALEAANYTGNITFNISIKDGQTKQIGHYNTKQTDYQGK